MFERFFGPTHTFKDALIILEKGLRSGEITVEGEGEEEIDKIRVTNLRKQILSQPQDPRKVPGPR